MLADLRRRLRTTAFLRQFDLTKSAAPEDALKQAVKFAGVALAAAVMILAVYEVFRETLTIELFEVSEKLAKQGYSGHAVAERFSVEMEVIRKEVDDGTSTGVRRSVDPGSHSTKNVLDSIEIPGAHLSVRAIVAAAKEMLRLPTTTVSGSFAESGNRLHLYVRVEDESKDSPRAKDFEGAMDDPTALIANAAQWVVSLVDPMTAAMYRNQHIRSASDRDDVWRLLDVALDRETSPGRRVRLLQLQARLYNEAGAYYDSLDALQQAVTLVPSNVGARLQFAEYLTTAGEFEAALGQLAAAQYWDRPWYRPFGRSPREQAIETDRAYVFLGRWAQQGNPHDRDVALAAATRAVALKSEWDGPWAYNGLGDVELEFDDFDNAHRRYESGAEFFSSAAEAHERLAEDALRRGRPLEAAREASAAHEKDPRWLDPVLQEAYARIELQQFPEAAERIAVADVLAPGSPSIPLAYGALWREQHRFVDARDAFAMAAQRASPEPPTGSRWHRVRMLAEADARINLADAWYALDDRPNAEMEAKAAIALNRTSIWPHVTLAEVAIERDDFSFANGMLDAAKSYHPNNADLSRASYDLAAAQGLDDVASAHLARADEVEINERSVDTLIARGGMLADQGQLAAAEEQYRRALSRTDHLCRSLIGLAEVEAARGNTKLGESLFRKAIAHHPTYLDAYWRWANALRDSEGNFVEAERLYALALSTGGTEIPNYDVFVNRGIARAAHGDSAAAINDFDKALELIPGSSTALAWRAMSQLRRGDDTRSAEADLQEANARNPGLAVRLLRRGRVLQAQHRNVLAQKYLEIAVRLAPERSDEATSNR